jgi:Family of unknown function (DUF5309)
MTTFQTYEQVGIKEDVSDIITNLTPTKTPFQSAIGSEKIHNIHFEWQEDTLRAAGSNAQLEGADASFVTVHPTSIRTNRTQILTEAVQVSETTDTVSTYGRAKEMAYQMRKSSSQLKRDLEFAYVGSAQTLVIGSDTVARQMNSAQLMIDASAIVYTGGTVAVPAPLTEVALMTALQECYTNGAEPTRIQVTPTNSVVLAAFAAAAGRFRTFQNATPGDKMIVNVVNLYVSPFGEQKVEINRFIKAKNTLVYDPSMWAKAVLRPWARTALAKTGDSSKQQIVGEMSLKHKNFFASGMVVEAVSGFAPV